MRIRMLAIVLGAAACSFAGAADRADLASWVAGLGGSTTRNESGRIVTIDLRASWVTDLEIENLLGADEVRELDLSHTHVSDVVLQTIAKLPELRSLSLRFASTSPKLASRT